MAVSISLGITQNSQNIANNTSNVTVKVTAKWTGGSFNRNDPSGSCTINGTKYTFTSDFNASQTTSGSQVIYSKTLNITHNSDGTKTLSCSASFATGVSSGTVTTSASKTLTTIPRKSTMSVGNGTLGTAQTLTVTRKSTSFTHTITATCGSASTTICTKSTSTSISFTPPLAWASQNTTGTSVSVKYTITTYSGSTSVGSNSYTVTCSIPASIKPSVSMTVSDPTGYLSTYGGYVQGLSKFTVSLSASGSYSSTIKSYSTTANGATYTASSFTTGVITGSGTLSINTTITDSRSRTATASKSVTVLAYAVPKISAFSIARCNQDGTANSGGSYMKVTFSSSVTSLNSKNKSTYTLKYKKTTDSAYTTVTLSNYANNYAVSGGSYIFAADTASSYNVTLTLADNFKSVSTSGTGSTATKTMSLYKQGKGVAFGKIAETSDVLESAWIIKGTKENNWLGRWKFPSDYIANYATAVDETTRKGWIGWAATNDLYITNETGGYVRLGNSTSRHTISAGHHYFANGTTYYINNSGGARLASVTGVGTDNWLGKHRFYGEWLGMYNTANGGTRKGYIGHDGSTHLYVVNEAGGSTYYNTGANHYFNKGVLISSGNLGSQSPYTSGFAMYGIWRDGSNHDIVGKSNDGLGCFLGWTGSASYASVCTIRGRTCRYTNSSGTTNLSDKNLKKDFVEFSEVHDNFFDNLKPTTYKYIQGSSGRQHFGYITQEVEEALEKAGLTTKDFGGVNIVKLTARETEKDDVTGEIKDIEDSADNYLLDRGIKEQHNLVYTEFISLNTWQIQKLKTKVKEQQEEIDILKQEMQQLKELVAKLVS